MERLNSPQELEKYKKDLLESIDPEKKTITLCAGTGCKGSGADAVVAAFKEALDTKKLGGKVKLLETGCHGFCEQGTIVVIRPANTFYRLVKPEDVEEIIEESVLKDNVLERLLYVDPGTGEKIEKEEDIPFYKRQKRIVFGANEHIDPTSINDYIARGGYQALAKALLKMKPEKIIDEVKKSGLRGRGGGGFLAGRKWEFCRNAHTENGDGTRYVICNADEGDPGAYMDRSLLEGNPHSVLEGMIIGAFAIGSKEGYVYVRHEYPLAVKHLEKAIEDARIYGFLGADIFSSGFDFDVKIVRGGGAFICGESTALMLSLEGKAGRPRAKYIHTVESGLNGKPTCLNNVETWANVPLIIDKGAKWYGKIGTDGSKGTKIFSLVGKINNTGLVEVPMGMTLKEIIYDIGGGIPNGKKFKAVQTGGPSGGCIPETLLDLPVDFDELDKAGSMMGSGGLIVMDETTCMVDLARYFIDFLKEESCGKCTPCREGIKRMLEVLEAICAGKGKAGDIELLEDLCGVLENASLCALGGTAHNPVLTTIKYFRDEYEAHINDKRCPAASCKDLITFTINEENCNGCGLCRKQCPVEAISGEKKQVHTLDQDKCIRCGICHDACKFDAVNVA